LQIKITGQRLKMDIMTAEAAIAADSAITIPIATNDIIGAAA
jgi:hypothetical protein